MGLAPRFYFLHLKSSGFADSKGDDVALIRDRWYDLAEAVVTAICEFLGYKYVGVSGFDTYTVIKGDTLYGGGDGDYNSGQDLRCSYLEFTHPFTGKKIIIE